MIAVLAWIAVKTLLDEGVDPNTCTADGLTALHQASIENSIKVAGLLLNAGAHVNRIDNDWWTPLHAAAACDHWRIVNLLIANGAKTDVVNVDGDLPVDLAEGTKTKAILESEMQSLGIDDKAREKLLGRDEFAFKAQVTGAINTGADLNLRGWNQESLVCCNVYLLTFDTFHHHHRRWGFEDVRFYCCKSIERFSSVNDHSCSC